MGITEAELFHARGLAYAGPVVVPTPAETIFDHPIWRRIVPHEGHWIWQGAFGAHGPEYRAGAAYVNVLRWMYSVCERELTSEETLRNTCHRLRCVFPIHWSPETRSALRREQVALQARGGPVGGRLDVHRVSTEVDNLPALTRQS